MFTKQARQGDLLITRVSNVPKDVKMSSDKVLALGESTGHMHQTQNSMVFRNGDNRVVQYLEIVDPDAIVHEEHAPINLDSGNYQVVRQREFDYSNRFQNILNNRRQISTFHSMLD